MSGSIFSECIWIWIPSTHVKRQGWTQTLGRQHKTWRSLANLFSWNGSFQDGERLLEVILQKVFEVDTLSYACTWMKIYILTRQNPHVHMHVPCKHRYTYIQLFKEFLIELTWTEDKTYLYYHYYLNTRICCYQFNLYDFRNSLNFK